MNLSTNKFFNSTDVHISSRMNEYLKKNFGYVVDGDFDKLHEAKLSLEIEKEELKKEGYMNKKYVENMLMIETITSLLKAHGEDTPSSYTHEEVTEAHLDLPETGDITTSNASPEIETVEEDEEEEKGIEHYRYKNDSQLANAKDKLIACMAQLDYAIDYRAKNSHLFFNTGDKAGTGDLYKMKEQLEKLHDSWEEATELYGM
tara:strand:+ start:120 stop:728 length:609 start_codon:yes stop_codon:yes gene_type:complete